MRSDQSRTVRWTVHVTQREFEALEVLRCDWPGRELRRDGAPQSRAELLMSLVTWLMFDDPAVAAWPRVAEAWQRVEHELASTFDHLERGGRRPQVRVAE
jgi:hypothetical protein